MKKILFIALMLLVFAACEKTADSSKADSSKANGETPDQTSTDSDTPAGDDSPKPDADKPAGDVDVAGDTDVEGDTDTPEGDIDVEGDTDTPAGDKDSVADEDPFVPDGDIATQCMNDACKTHDDCKKEGCDATFCTAVLKPYKPEVPEVCVLRCDPKNNNLDCPSTHECNGGVAALTTISDGAKGICVTKPVQNDGDVVADGDAVETDDDVVSGDADTPADVRPAANAFENYTFSYGETDNTACGYTISYEKWNYNFGAKATIVLVNGRTEYTDKHHHMISLLNRQWNVVMLDHFGQGRSDGVRAHADDFDTQHVCALKHIIETQVSGALPVFVMAHSMGGFVATRFAELYPKMVDGFVLSSPMYGTPLPQGYTPEIVKNASKAQIDAGNGEKPKAVSQPRSACKNEAGDYINGVTHDCDFYNQFKDDPFTTIGEPTWGWVYAAFTGFDDLFLDYADITEPMFILQAGEESVVLPAKHDEFCALVNTSDTKLAMSQCTIKKYDGKFHELFNETGRADIVKDAKDWIDSVSPTMTCPAVCDTHNSCKVAGCPTTFCAKVLQPFMPEAPAVCLLRCDPVNNNADCPANYECNGAVALLGEVADGAKGVCSPKATN